MQFEFKLFDSPPSFFLHDDDDDDDEAGHLTMPVSDVS